MNKETILQNLADNIKKECQKRNIALEALCKRSGISPAMIYNMRNGFLPSIEKIAAIAEYCGVSVDYLIGFQAGTASEPKESNIERRNP